MARLAFHTFGILHEAREHPESKGFYDRLPHVFASAENSKGYVERAPARNAENQDSRWGDPDV